MSEDYGYSSHWAEASDKNYDFSQCRKRYLPCVCKYLRNSSLLNMQVGKRAFLCNSGFSGKWSLKMSMNVSHFKHTLWGL